MAITVIMQDSRPDGAGGTYKKGSTYSLPDTLATYFIDIGLAKRTSTRSEQTGLQITGDSAGRFPSAPAQDAEETLKVRRNSAQGVEFDAATTAAIQKAASAASLVATGLLGGVSNGFALDTTEPNRRRVVQTASNGIVSYAAVEDLVPTDCICAKMTEQADGSLKWSDHNLFVNSDDITAAGWVKTGITPTAGVSYTADASAATLTASATPAYVGQVPLGAAQYPYRTIQAICKAGTASIVYLEQFDTQARRAYFDLAAGTVGTTDAGVTATISTTDSDGIALPDGYYRIIASYRSGALAPPSRIGIADVNGSVAVTVGKTVVIERPHLHYGMRPLTYLRNGGAAAKFTPVYHDKYGMLLELAHYVCGKWSDDLSQAIWAKTSVTAALTATGPDSEPCSTITATADGGTVTQAITFSGANQTFSAYIKRRTGTGAIYMTANGGTTWTDVSASLVDGKFVRVKVHGEVNPTVGFKIGTSGDAFDISKATDVPKIFMTSPLATYSVDKVVALATTLNIPKSAAPYDGELTLFVDWYRGDETSSLETSYPFSLKDDIGAQYTRLGISTTGQLLFGNIAGGPVTNHAFHKVDTPNAQVACTVSVATSRQCVSINGDPTLVVDNTGIPAWTSLAFRQTGVNDTSQMYVKRVVVVPGAISADEVRTWRWSGAHPYIVDSRIVNAVRDSAKDGAPVTWQREPMVCVLSDNGEWADFAIVHMQKYVTGFMGEAPARLVQRNYRFVKSTGKLSALTDSIVVASPPRFTEGLGHMQSPCMGRIPVGPNAGKFALIYNNLDSPQQTFTPDARNVYMMIGDGTPTGWGAPTMIFEAATIGSPYFVLSPGMRILVLPSTHPVAPNRMIVLGYTQPPTVCYGFYSDDGGQTWVLGNPYDNASYHPDESTLTLAPDGSLVATHRTNVDLKRLWSVSTDGGVTFADQGLLDSDLEYKCGAGAAQLDPTGAISKYGVIALSRPTTSTRYGLRISKVSAGKAYGHVYPWSADRASGYSALAAIFGGTHLILASEAGVGRDRYSVQVCVIKL